MREGLSAKTIRRLRDVVARIPAKQFDMRYWIKRKGRRADAENGLYDAPEAKEILKDCGSVGCLYGWACAFYPVNTGLLSVWLNGDKIFGLDVETSEKLCGLRHWPRAFKSRYQKAKTPATRLRVLRDRVEHFIATEGRDA